MIDIEKFICSLLTDHPEGAAVRSDIHKALKDQGLEYKDGKIVSIEDERVWLTKFIQEEIDCLRFDIRDCDDRIKLKNLQRSLAWLERQEEQKPVVIIPKFRVGDVIRLKEGASEYTIKKVTDTAYYTKGWSCDIKRCEEDYELVEQTSTWSEEDERMCLCLIEDQEEVLNNVDNAHICHPEIIPGLKEMYNERISWLKSLKERCAWKPSREQMKYLHKYAEQNNYDGAILTGLYDDLLKIYDLKQP